MPAHRRVAARARLPLTLLLLVLALGGAARPGAAQADSRFFPETGHTVQGRFLAYWLAHGGLAQQGYPLSDEMREVSPADQKPYTVQYFERAVFEYHPENAAPYDVLLSLLGVFDYAARYPGGAPAQQAGADSPRYFPETRHTVAGAFRRYWESHGGLPQQGYPLSDEFTGVSPLDGRPYTMQYFQRAVFERHPENAGTPYEVLLSQLGTFRYRARYQSLAIPPPAPGQAQFLPQGSDRYLVWSEAAPGAAGAAMTVRGLDIQSGRPLTVTTAPGDQENPVVAGPLVVWSDRGAGCPPDCATADIRGQDLATGATFPVAVTAAYEADPAIAGRTVAYLDMNADALRIVTRDLDSPDVREWDRIPLQNGMGFGPGFAPPALSERYVVWAREGISDPHTRGRSVSLQVGDRQTGAVRTVAEYSERESDRAEYSIDGARLIWTPGAFGVQMLDLRSGAATPLYDAGPAAAPLLHGDVALWRGQGGVYGRRLAGGRPVALVPGGPEITFTVAGDWLVYTDGPALASVNLAAAFIAPPGPPPIPTPTAGPTGTPPPPAPMFTETPPP
jgi:hypothetical protein